MKQELVSIVIPTYNYGHFVGEAVESALGQTWSAREVIVVDDGSTDDTAERLASYGTQIHYVRQNNLGLSAARNTGIRLARGRFVALLDSDDVWHPRKLELQLRYLAQHHDVMLLGSACHTEDCAAWPTVNENPTAEDVSLEDVLVRSWFAPSTAVLRRECLDSTNWFDTSLRSVEDRDLWIRLASRYRIGMLQAPLCWYRLHNGSMSKAALCMEEFEWRVLRNAFTRLEPLRGRWLLQCKALSYALASSSWMHREAGASGIALCRLFWSLALWPFPFPRRDCPTTLARTRLLASLVARGLHRFTSRS